jgi:hypothetical protein
MNCPYCWGRIQAGITDLSTTHPHLVAELVVYPQSRPATALSAGSDYKAHWKCATGHTYRMRVCKRVQLDRCPECLKELNASRGQNITITHPAIAAEWDFAKNDGRRPEHFSHGSGEDAMWLCSIGHSYQMRIERRTAGAGCKVCSRRELVPGVTDLASQEPVLVKEFHPYLNGPKEPDEIFPGNGHFIWRCLAAKHVTTQSVPNRRKSKGCTECPPEHRILNQIH